jgi:hypothetical protein
VAHRIGDIMSRFLILIHGDESRWDAIADAEMAQIDAGHRAFRERAGSAVLSSGQLGPSRQGRTLRSRSKDGIVFTDGPFAETSEVVGGFYVIEAADLDAATELAALLAEVDHDHSAVEIQPLVGG